MKLTKKLFSMTMVMLLILISMSISVFAAPAPTPTATFVADGDTSGRLNGVTTRMEYSVDGGAQWVDIDDAPDIGISNVTPTHGIKLRDKGNNSEIEASAIQEIAVTKHPDLDASRFEPESPTSAANNDGKIVITGNFSELEYRTASTSEYQSVTSNTITGLRNGRYLIRTKASGATLASNFVLVQVQAYTSLPAGDTPTDIVFTGTDYDKGKLSDFNGRLMKYTTDGIIWYENDASDRTVILEDINDSTVIKVVRKAYSGHSDSAEHIINVTRAATPSGVIAENATNITTADGKIKNVTTDMEYKKSTEDSWTAIASTEVTNLAVGTYHVRTKGSVGKLASENFEVNVGATNLSPITGTVTVTGTFKFNQELTATFNGTPSTNLTYKWFRVNGGTETLIPGQNGATYTTVEQDIGDFIRVKVTSDLATGEVEGTTDSTISKADGDVAPTGLNGQAPTAVGNDGKITGTRAGMEYANDAVFTSPVDINGNEVTGLSAGTYYVRLKETSTKLASEHVEVIVPAYMPPANDLEGTATISGTPKFGETLRASLTGGNSTDLNYKWFRNTTLIPTATTETYTLTEDDITHTIKVEIGANDKNGTKESAPTVAIERADGPAAPTGLNAQAPTAATSNDGKITGVNNTMEYATTSDFATPMAIAGNEITSLAPATYYVRVKETATHHVGMVATVTVPNYSESSGGTSGGGSFQTSPVRPDKYGATTPTQPATKTELKNGESRLSIGSKTAEAMKDGKLVTITMDAAPFIQNGRTMVPLRYVAELLGLKVEYLPATKTAKLTAENVEILVPINKTTMMVNGKTVESDQMPILKDNRTYLSISNIVKALGLEEGKNIVWDNSSKEVIIKK